MPPFDEAVAGRSLDTTIDLIRGYKAGRNGVQEELFEKLRPRVLRIVRVRMGAGLRRQMESIDVAHDALLRLVRDLKQARLDHPGQLVMWLAAVVENQLRDAAKHARAAKRDAALELPLEELRAALSSPDLRFDPEGADPTPLDAAADKELAERMDECLVALSEEHREVLLHRRVAGLSLAETAKLMGRSEKAVSMLCGRAGIAFMAECRKRKLID